MPELTDQQFADSFNEPADPAAVEAYLKVSDNRIVSELAALMPIQQNLNPDQALERACELIINTGEVTAHKRIGILLSMNFETLISLLSRIGYNLEMLAQNRHITGLNNTSGVPEINDPIKGPVFAVIAQRMPFLKKSPEIEQKSEIDAVIEKASLRNKLPCPDFPCDLEEALRWAANAPDTPFKILNLAYLDYLKTHSPCGAADSIREELAGYEEEIRHARNDKAKLLEITEQTKHLKKMLALWESIDRYQADFKPMKTDAPKKVTKYAKEIHAMMNLSKSINSRSALANLASRYYAFWGKHQSSYLKHAEKKSITNRKSGAGGPISRMRREWVHRTEKFVVFAKGQEIPGIGTDKWFCFLNEFAEHPGRDPIDHHKDPRTNKKIAAFISTVFCHAKSNNWNNIDDEIIERLEKEGVKAIDQETLRQCIEVFRSLETA